jgi:glycosyltransferase involved in cell wall biosynthesis
MEAVSTSTIKANLSKPTRVAHLIGQLDPGGIETWLLHLMEQNKDQLIDYTIIVQNKTGSDFEKSFLKLGVKILCCEVNRSSSLSGFSYLLRLRRLLIAEGPFEVVHTHLQWFSAIPTIAALLAGVPVRVVHSHNCFDNRKLSFARRWYEKIMTKLIGLTANLKLAVSKESGEDLFGSSSNGNVDNFIVHTWGFNFDKYASKVDPGDLRQELGLAPDAKLLVHVGRFARQKNHEFLIELFAYITKQHNCYLLLVGQGNLRSKVESLVKEKSLDGKVLFLGSRLDVPRILKCADLFVFPSLHEGLPLVVVEAQAAGLPIVMSQGIPESAIVIPELVTRLPINDRNFDSSDNDWIQAISMGLSKDRKDSTYYYQQIRNSHFDIHHESEKLNLLYARFLEEHTECS